MPTNEPLRIEMTLGAGADTDARVLDADARNLKRQIEGLGAESVSLVSAGAAPPGTRSPEIVAAGSLLVGLLPTLLPKLIDFLQSWLPNRENRTVKFKVSDGDKTVEFEYAPSLMSKDDALSLIAGMKDAVRDGGKDAPR